MCSRGALKVTAAVSLAVGAIGSAWLLTPGPVRPGTLAHAVERETGSAGPMLDSPSECRPTGARTLRCYVLDSGGSGYVAYDVRRTHATCFAGTLNGQAGEIMPARIHGCVRLRDGALHVELL